MPAARTVWGESRAWNPGTGCCSGGNRSGPAGPVFLLEHPASSMVARSRLLDSGRWRRLGLRDRMPGGRRWPDTCRPMVTLLAARRRLGSLACRRRSSSIPRSTRSSAPACCSRPRTCSASAPSSSAAPTTRSRSWTRPPIPGGVVACSSGNHAQGVAAAATLRGLKSTIVMPADAPRLKIERTKAFGGEVVAYDRVKEDRDAIARELCARRAAPPTCTRSTIPT